MLTLNHHGVQLCDGLSRREWLRAGGLATLGISLPELVLSRSQAANPVNGKIGSSFGKAKSCILLFMLGGPPQHETWDPKPDAPVEVRGNLSCIRSVTPGLQVGELMPKTAQLTEHIAVIRAMATDDNAHSSSGYWMLTGSTGRISH